MKSMYSSYPKMEYLKNVLYFFGVHTEKEREAAVLHQSKLNRTQTVSEFCNNIKLLKQIKLNNFQLPRQYKASFITFLMIYPIRRMTGNRFKPSKIYEDSSTKLGAQNNQRQKKTSTQF